MKPRRKPGPLPRRYRRTPGRTNFDLAQKREDANRAAGQPSDAKPATDLPIPTGESAPVVDWCEPLDPIFRAR